jgi:hypothetical protein
MAKRFFQTEITWPSETQPASNLTVLVLVPKKWSVCLFKHIYMCVQYMHILFDP